MRFFSLAAALLAAALLAVFCTAGAVQARTQGKPNSTPQKRAATKALTRNADTGIESQLSRILDEIQNSRLNSALQLTDTLVQHHPNFRLGHLIRGDLLLARSNKIVTRLGSGITASSEPLSDLREEALARLQAYRQKPASNTLPRYLQLMSNEQEHALVVDMKKSRLYLYQNSGNSQEAPRLLADYYISHGKLGGNKTKEGDKKTPIGVYYVTSSLPRQKLGDFYGFGAFPISYPNEWDKRQGRAGHGIWLHGTPSDTYSRPPRSSDGCIVLANPDLEALAKNLPPGTPVIISHEIEWVGIEDIQRQNLALTKAIETWRADWESLDTERFLRHYSKKLQTNNQNFEQFAQQKRQVNSGKEWIKLGLSNLSIFRNPGKEDLLVVTFEQDYRSNNLSNRMRKRQYWQLEQGEWKIVQEGAA